MVNLLSKVEDITRIKIPVLLYILLAKLQFFAGKHSMYAGAALKKFVDVPGLYVFLTLAQLLESEKKIYQLKAWLLI